MQYFSSPDDIPHLLRHRYVADNFDKARITEIATLLSQPENTQIYLISKSLDDY